jgi:hypothetical protein
VILAGVVLITRGSSTPPPGTARPVTRAPA